MRYEISLIYIGLELEHYFYGGGILFFGLNGWVRFNDINIS